MRKILLTTLGIIIASLGLYGIYSEVQSADPFVFFRNQGGTGTSTKPTDGHILAGDGTGEYGLVEIVASTNMTISTTTSADGLGTWTFSATDSVRLADVILTVSGATTYLQASTTGNAWLFPDGFVSQASSTIDSTLTMTGDLILTDNDAVALGTGLDSRLYYDGTDTFLDLRAVGTGDLMIALAGSFPSPDPGTVHIWEGSAGVITADANLQLAIENSGNAGINILSGNTSVGLLAFGDDGSALAGFFQYDHNNTRMDFGVEGSSRVILTTSSFDFQQATTITTPSNQDLTITAEGTGDLLLTADSDTFVGIGTTTPGTPLSVTGEAVITGLLTIPSLVATSTTATSTLAGGFAIETSGLVYDFSSNNVGVGTANPASTLDVNGTIRATETYFFSDGSTQSYGATPSGFDWHIGTASFLQSTTTATEDASPQGIFFKPDGLKMYLLGGGADDIFEYDLGTAWDVSTAVINQSTDVGAQNTLSRGLFIRSDGLRLWVVGGADGEMNEYNLTTAWDISTLSFSRGASLAENGNIFSVRFRPDGLKMYVTGNSSANEINEYDLSTAWDVSTLTFNQVFTAAAGGGLTGLEFKSDGTRVYTSNVTTDLIDEYTLSTPWDISTSVLGQSLDVSSEDGSPQDIFIRHDATKIYVTGSDNDIVAEYDLGLSILGNVGVGTTTPGSILSVQGVANFTADATSTIYTGVTVPQINATSTTATSTFANGIQLSGGCFKDLKGFCINTLGSFSVPIASSTLSTTTGYFVHHGLPFDFSIFRVDCSSNFGSTTIQADERAVATPQTAGTDVFFNTSSSLTGLGCNFEGNTSTTTFNNGDISAFNKLNFTIEDAQVSNTTDTLINMTFYYERTSQ